MSENKCLGYTLSIAGHTIKVDEIEWRLERSAREEQDA